MRTVQQETDSLTVSRASIGIFTFGMLIALGSFVVIFSGINVPHEIVGLNLLLGLVVMSIGFTIGIDN